jgi:hypothetical protein
MDILYIVVEEFGQISPEQNSLALISRVVRKSAATHSTICGTTKLRFVLNYLGEYHEFLYSFKIVKITTEK